MQSTLQKILNDLDISQESFEINIFLDAITPLIVKSEEVDVTAEHIAFSDIKEFNDWQMNNYIFDKNKEDEKAKTDKILVEVLKSKYYKDYSDDQSLSQIVDKILKYWQDRALNAKNLTMKARYYGLSIYFLTKMDHANLRNYIEILIEICDKRCTNTMFLVNKIVHAYKLARSINDESLIKKTICAAISLEDSIEYWRYRGFCFAEFVLGKEKELTKEQADKLIQDLENGLTHLAQNNDAHGAKQAGELLATYYNKNSKTSDVERVITTVGNTYEKLCESNNRSPLIIMDYYQIVYGMYHKFHMHQNARMILKKIEEMGPKIKPSMSVVHLRTEIPMDKINSFISKLTEGGKECALTRIAYYLIPKKDNIEKLVVDLAKDFPIQNMVPKTLYAYNGRPNTTIKNVKDDLDNNIIYQLAIQISCCNSPIIELALKKVIEDYKISSNDLLEDLYKSPLFEEDKKEIFKLGLNAYFKEEYIYAIHTLLPQIEACLRRFVDLCGSVTTYANKTGGVELECLDSLLKKIEKLNEKNEDIVLYLKTVLTAQSGLNLRHNVCHGIIHSAFFNKTHANLILHILLCFAVVRRSDVEPQIFLISRN